MPSRDSNRFLPRLWMVFALVGLCAFALALFGLALVRVYDNQLIRQTESELISQGVVLGELYRARLQPHVDERYGLPRIEPWPFPVPADGLLQPILPSLRASDPVWPAALGSPPSPDPPDGRAAQVGESMGPLLNAVARSTLAGIRLVDHRGVVVASSGAGLGTTMADRLEIQRALRGLPNSILRQRPAVADAAPLESLSREAGVRISVALPVIERDRICGAVYLSRTPMTLAKAFYVDRWNLTATGLVLLFVLALVSLAGAALVVRPLRALVRQTRSIAAGDPSGYKSITRPRIRELAQLSEAFATMALALRDRNDYIRSFAANVSHEFKTPLSSIQGAVELLQDNAAGMTEEQRQRFLNNITEDARRLTTLVRKLLELARADSMTANQQRCNIAQVVTALVQRASTEDIKLRTAPIPPHVEALLPADILDAVLWQLVCNARQHGGDGVNVHIAVTLSTEGTANIVVKDDGPGISEANRARIFDAFFTTARAHGGTGLGLTIARSMMRAFGARVDLLPPQTVGTAFQVTVPLNRPVHRKQVLELSTE